MLPRSHQVSHLAVFLLIGIPLRYITTVRRVGQPQMVPYWMGRLGHFYYETQGKHFNVLCAVAPPSAPINGRSYQGDPTAECSRSALRSRVLLVWTNVSYSCSCWYGVQRPRLLLTQLLQLLFKRQPFGCSDDCSTNCSCSCSIQN